MTVPVIPLGATGGGVAVLAFSNLGPEPISNEPPNVTSPQADLASNNVTHADVSHPYTADRRAVVVSDVSGSTTRNLRFAFPSGHWPRAGQSLPLNVFDRVQLTYFEGDMLSEGGNDPVWEADHGVLVVDVSDDNLLTVHLEGAGFQSESPTAKGIFDFDGEISVPVKMP